MYNIYISSTYLDLIPYRAAVHLALEQLGHRVIAMEAYVATDTRPADKCVADVAGCDVYVGILAWRYGFVPAADNPLEKSITELEYDSAGTHKRPRLIFLLDPKAAWVPGLMDMTTGEGESGRRIRDFRARVTTDHLVSHFDSPSDLASKALAAVARLEGPVGAGSEADALMWRRLAQSIPISAALRVQLESARIAHEAANVRFVTGSLLLALLESDDGFAASQFNLVQAGLAEKVIKTLTTYVRDHLPLVERGYVPFDWGERWDVQRAQTHALLDGSPAISAKHLTLAVLESDKSSAIKELKGYIGAPTFDELVRTVREADEWPPLFTSYSAPPKFDNSA